MGFSENTTKTSRFQMVKVCYWMSHPCHVFLLKKMQVEEASSLTTPENEHHYPLKIDGWFQMIHVLFKMFPFFGDIFRGGVQFRLFLSGRNLRNLSGMQFIDAPANFTHTCLAMRVDYEQKIDENRRSLRSCLT